MSYFTQPVQPKLYITEPYHSMYHDDALKKQIFKPIFDHLEDISFAKPMLNPVYFVSFFSQFTRITLNMLSLQIDRKFSVN